MKVFFKWHNHNYFPYEKKLAFQELLELTGNNPLEKPGGLEVQINGDWKIIADRSTYFLSADSENGETIIPLQTLLEATNGNGNTKISTDPPSIELAKQSTRYSAHGLHEYRGKYNPQIVRAIGNILKLEQGNWIIDPFCGSGTTLVEGFHSNYNVVGIDINPLAVEISNAKINSLLIPSDELEHGANLLKQSLSDKFSNLDFSSEFPDSLMDNIGGKSWKEHSINLPYLEKWFSKSILFQLRVMLEEISKLPSKQLQSIFTVILSDIVREVSFQNPLDLRIRRRKELLPNVNVVDQFSKAIDYKLKSLYKSKKILTERAGIQKAFCNDIRDISQECFYKFNEIPFGNFNAAITSPPYATGLPYIDTDRLSLVLLNLIKSTEIMPLQKSLIGNREISPSEREMVEQHLQTNEANLPQKTIEFCQFLKASVNVETDGFRKQNVPAVIYQYLVGMATAFSTMRMIIANDAPFVLVVGKNKTTLGNNLIIIDTPSLLMDIAKSVGYAIEESLALDTYPRFDIHKANSIDSETMIILRNKLNEY